MFKKARLVLVETQCQSFLAPLPPPPKITPPPGPLPRRPAFGGLRSMVFRDLIVSFLLVLGNFAGAFSPLPSLLPSIGTAGFQEAASSAVCPNPSMMGYVTFPSPGINQLQSARNLRSIERLKALSSTVASIKQEISRRYGKNRSLTIRTGTQLLLSTRKPSSRAEHPDIIY